MPWQPDGTHEPRHVLAVDSKSTGSSHRQNGLLGHPCAPEEVSIQSYPRTRQDQAAPHSSLLLCFPVEKDRGSKRKGGQRRGGRNQVGDHSQTEYIALRPAESGSRQGNSLRARVGPSLYPTGHCGHHCHHSVWREGEGGSHCASTGRGHAPAARWQSRENVQIHDVLQCSLPRCPAGRLHMPLQQRRYCHLVRFFSSRRRKFCLLWCHHTKDRSVLRRHHLDTVAESTASERDWKHERNRKHGARGACSAPFPRNPHCALKSIEYQIFTGSLQSGGV